MNIRAATTARRLLQLAVILILTACALPGLQAQNNTCLDQGNAATIVQIGIDDNTGLPKFDNRIFCAEEDQSDPAIDKKNGNVCLDVNKKPDLKFQIPGAGANNWEFIEIQLSGDNQNWPGELPLGAYSDFEFGSDAALITGKPYFKIEGNHAIVRNNNCHQFKVWYRILLKQAGQNGNPDFYYYLHPIMDNRGSNNNN